MITRIFRVRVPLHLHEEFEEKFCSTSISVVEEQAGMISVFVGRPTHWAPEEYAMISTWEDELALRAFAGDEWNQPVIPKGMEKYVDYCWVHHYEIFG